MFWILILLAFSSLNVSLALESDEDKVAFMLDFLKSQTKPTDLIVWRDCFDEKLKVQLMMGSFISTVFNKQDSLNESDFRENPQHSLFALDLTCTDEAERIILKIEASLFSHPYRWILFVEDDKVLNNIRALPDSDVVIVQRATNDDGFVLKQFYKIDEETREIHYENYGVWSSKSGIIDQRETTIISRRRSDLKGKTITTSYVILNPDSMNHLTDYRFKEIDSVTKVNYIIWNHILDQLNATKKEIFRNTWGYPDKKTGKWTGMVGDIIEGVSDIGGTVLFITADRIPLIEYVPSNVATKLRFVFRAPQLSAVSNIYTLPFRANVWLSCLILVLLSSVLLYLTTSQSHKLTTEGQETNQPKRFTDSVLSTIAAVAQMDPMVIQSSVTSSRLIMFFIFLTFAFLYSAYTANIVSLLQSPSKSIRTMEDLYNSKLKLGVDDAPYNRYYTALGETPLEKKVYLEKIAPPGKPDNFLKAKDGVSKVRRGMYAFLLEENVVYKLMGDTFLEHEKCELVSIEFIRVSFPYLSIRKRSPYKEMLKVRLLKAMETGVKQRILSKLYTTKPVCVNRLNFQSISIEDSLPGLLLVPYGIVLSFAVLLVEKILHLLNFNQNWCLRI